MMAYGPITSRQIEVDKMERVADFIFPCSKITADGDCSHEILMLAPWKKSYEKPRQYIKKQVHHSSNKLCIVKAVFFFPVVMYRCESCTIKKVECWIIDSFKLLCWWRLLRVSWTARRSNHNKGNKLWLFIGSTDAEAEAPILWWLVKSWLIVEDLDAGKDWGQEAKGATEDEKVGWHHQLIAHEFEETVGNSGGQRSLVCYSP